VQNFSKFSGGNNIPGFSIHYFIEDWKILYMPEPVNGIINLSEIIYISDDDRFWYVGNSVLKTLNLSNDLSKTVDGVVAPILIEGVVANQEHQNLTLFTEKTASRFLVIVKDRNGKSRICGEPGNGLFFTFKDILGGFSFAYKANYKHPAWYTTGDIETDGGEVDTGLKVVLKLNAGAFLTPPAGTTVDLLLRDQGGNPITPASTSGAQINITLPKTLVWQLNFNGIDDVIFVEAVTAENIGTLTSGTGTNVGTITVSTDGGTTYGALSFPFTPVNGTTYHFKRSSTSVSGKYKMTGTYV
jgi:hypothetical protein